MEKAGQAPYKTVERDNMSLRLDVCIMTKWPHAALTVQEDKYERDQTMKSENYQHTKINYWALLLQR